MFDNKFISFFAKIIVSSHIVIGAKSIGFIVCSKHVLIIIRKRFNYYIPNDLGIRLRIHRHVLRMEINLLRDAVRLRDVILAFMIFTAADHVFVFVCCVECILRGGCFLLLLIKKIFQSLERLEGFIFIDLLYFSDISLPSRYYSVESFGVYLISK